MRETLTKTRYIYWPDEGMFLGYLEEYPDYWTQGHSLEELQQNLLDLYQEFTQGNIPCEINETLAKHIIKMLQNP